MVIEAGVIVRFWGGEKQSKTVSSGHKGPLHPWTLSSSGTALAQLHTRKPSSVEEDGLMSHFMASRGRKSRFYWRVWTLVVDLTPVDGCTPMSIWVAHIRLNGLLKELRRREVWGHGGLGSESERSCMTTSKVNVNGIHSMPILYSQNW